MSEGPEKRPDSSSIEDVLQALDAIEREAQQSQHSQRTGIFISYRRSDSQDVAGRIFDRLTERFTQRRVFKDVDSIPLSVSFPVAITEALEQAAVALVLIGPNWAACEDAEGRRRLDNPLDPVRIEVETALRMGIPLVPVAVSNADLPGPDILPEPLKPIATRQGQPIRPDPDFHHDMNRLIERLSPLVKLDDAKLPKSLDSSVLTTLLDLCQGWYNQVVQTIADLMASDDRAEQYRIEFVYKKSREFMPRIVSIRGLLDLPECARLAKCVDDFVNLLTEHTDGRRACYESHILMQCLYAGRVSDDPQVTYNRVVTLPKLRSLEVTLQQVSDEVIQLLHRPNVPNMKA